MRAWFILFTVVAGSEPAVNIDNITWNSLVGSDNTECDELPEGTFSLTRNDMRISFRVAGPNEIVVSVVDLMMIDSDNRQSQVEYSPVSQSFTYVLKKDCKIEIVELDALAEMVALLIPTGIERLESATKIIEFLKPVQAIRLGSSVLSRPVRVVHDRRLSGIMDELFLTHIAGNTYVLAVEDTHVLLSVTRGDDAKRNDETESDYFDFELVRGVDLIVQLMKPETKEIRSSAIIDMFAAEGGVSKEGPFVFQVSEDSLSISLGSLVLTRVEGK